MGSPTISVRKVTAALWSRVHACEDAVERYEGRAADLGDDTYLRMAASERCAATELRHVLRMLFGEGEA